MQSTGTLFLPLHSCTAFRNTRNQDTATQREARAEIKAVKSNTHLDLDSSISHSGDGKGQTAEHTMYFDNNAAHLALARETWDAKHFGEQLSTLLSDSLQSLRRNHKGEPKWVCKRGVKRLR
jgi:hypothetical protein